MNSDLCSVTTQRLLDHPILTAEEEHLLGLKALGGCDRSRNRIVLCNVRLVVKLSMNFPLSFGMTRDDLISAGIVGLIAASKTFDPTMCRFSTFARFHILRQINKQIDLCGRGVTKVPPRFYANLSQIKKAGEMLSQKLDREPTDDEIAAVLGWSVVHVQDAKALSSPQYLDAPIGAESFAESFHSKISEERSTQEAIDLRADSELADFLLKNLSPKEGRIIRQRFGLDGASLTLEQLSKRYRVTRERIRQIEFKALKKMREAAKRMRELRGERALAA